MILYKGDQVPSLSDSLVTQYSHLHHDPVDNKSVLTDWKSGCDIMETNGYNIFLEDN